MKIPNYGETPGDGPGYHPPACTCFACNEVRLRREASQEEERRAAEYDRRVDLAGTGTGPRQRSEAGNRATARDPAPLSRSPSGPPRPVTAKKRLLAWVAVLLVAAGIGSCISVLVASQSGKEHTVAAAVPTEEATATPVPAPTAMPTRSINASQLNRIARAPTVTASSASSQLTPPRILPTAAATRNPSPPAATPVPPMSADELRQFVLEMINEVRQRAGVPPVALGTNGAAQIHADAGMKGCFAGHWGLDGATSGMRYALAGGEQVNGENVAGFNYCIRSFDYHSPIRDPAAYLRRTMNGLVASPGHYSTMVNEHYRKVNIGISSSRYQMVLVQQFEGDFVRFQEVPHLSGESLRFEGRTVNGAKTSKLRVDIYFHSLAPLTHPQVAFTYCLDIGLQVASLISPPRPGAFYKDLGDFTKSYTRCMTPYEVPETAKSPDSVAKAQSLHAVLRNGAERLATAQVKYVVSDEWHEDGTGFKVSANLGEVLGLHGPGVYQIVVWGSIDGRYAVITSYPVFYEVAVPTGYSEE